MDTFEAFKATQREGWAKFVPMQMITMLPAARLVSFSNICPGQKVLDAGCGTGVVAITAARMGAKVTGSDLTPELLEAAHENSRIAELPVEWREADVEQLPFGAAEFDVVISQFGHIFAPRPSIAVAEMLRVLKPGGIIAFSTWPPDLFTGRMLALVASYMPPPPPGVSPPVQWGDPNTVRERLGSAVRDIVFDFDTVFAPALSPKHFREAVEKNVGPIIKLVTKYSSEDPSKLAKFRREFEDIIEPYFSQNAVRQTYMLTRAVKI